MNTRRLTATRLAALGALWLAGCPQASEPADDDDDATDDVFTPRWVRTPLDEAAVFTIVGTEEAPVAWETLSFETSADDGVLHLASTGARGVSQIPMGAVEAAAADGATEAPLESLASSGIATGQVQSIWMGAPRDVDGDGIAEVLTEHESEKGILILDVWFPIDTRLVLHRGARLSEDGFVGEGDAWIVIDIGDEAVGTTYDARLVPDVTGDGGAELALAFRDPPGDKMLGVFTSEQLRPLPSGSLLTWEDAEFLIVNEVDHPIFGATTTTPTSPAAVPDLNGDGDAELMVVFDRVPDSGLSPRVVFLDDDALAGCGRPCVLPPDPTGPVVADIVNNVLEGGIDQFGMARALVGADADGGALLAFEGRVRGPEETDNRETVSLFRSSQITPGARLTRADGFAVYEFLDTVDPTAGEQLQWQPVTFVSLDGDGADELVVRGWEHRDEGLPLGVLGVIDVDAVPVDGDLEPHFLASFVAPDEEHLDPRLGTAVGYVSSSLGRGLAIPIDAGGDWQGAVWLVPAP
mgnify:CR=1 FL=1